MRLIKRQTTNLRNIYGKGVSYDVNDQVVMDSSNSVLIPKGRTDERPLSPVNGHLRYNTDNNEFELYQDDAWRKMRFKEPTPIHQQNIGVGDDTETKFGPLYNADSDYPYPASDASIIVLIENVFQISNTNYNVVQNPAGNSPSTGLPYPTGYYIDFTDPVPDGKPVTVLHNFDK
jgi:hypothetical protein